MIIAAEDLDTLICMKCYKSESWLPFEGSASLCYISVTLSGSLSPNWCFGNNMCVYCGVPGNTFVIMCASNEHMPNMPHYIQYALVIYSRYCSLWHWTCNILCINSYLPFTFAADGAYMRFLNDLYLIQLQHVFLNSAILLCSLF